MAAGSDVWWDSADWPTQPRDPGEEDQTTEPEPADLDGYEPI